MFKVGDTVKYGGNGICKITDIITRDFCGEATEYYVLQTVTGFDSIIYVPVNNELLCNKMQYLLSKEDAIKVIKDIPKGNIDWIEDVKKRTERFNSLLASHDRRDILGVIGLIYSKKFELQSIGKKLRVSDEHILNVGERAIFEELSVVLGIAKNDIPNFIKNIINE